MAETATKDAAAEEKEALRVDQQSVVYGDGATYISPDMSFVDGTPVPEEDLENVKTVTTEGWVIEPKSRQDRIDERKEEIKAAVDREKKDKEEKQKAADEEAERYANDVQEQRKLQTAIAGLVETGTRPRSESATKKADS